MLVSARDANGKPQSGMSVTLVMSGTGNSVNPANAQTDASGNATFVVSSTVAEAKTLTAATASALTVTFVSGNAAAASSAIALSNASIRADGKAATKVTITLVDANGNAAANAPLTVVISGEGNTPAGPISATADASGTYTFALTSTTAEEKAILVTFDGGTLSTEVAFHAAWVATGTGVSGFIDAMVVDPGTPATIYAAGYNGLFRSTDDGVTWSSASAGIISDFETQYFTALAVDVTTTPHRIYAATTTEVYTLAAGNSLWQVLPWPGGPVQRLAATGGALYAVGNAGESPNTNDYTGIYSPETGVWNVRTHSADARVVSTALAVDGTTASPIVYSATQDTTLGVEEQDFVSVNQQLTAGLPNDPFVAALAVNTHVTPSQLYALAGGKLYAYASGSGFSALMAGLGTSAYVEAITIDDTTGDLYAAVSDASDGRVAVLHSGATSWTEFTTTTLVTDCDAMALTSDKVLLGDFLSGVTTYPRSGSGVAAQAVVAPYAYLGSQSFEGVTPTGDIQAVIQTDLSGWRVYTSHDGAQTWSESAGAINVNVTSVSYGAQTYVTTQALGPILSVLMLSENGSQDVTGNIQGSFSYDSEQLSVNGETHLYVTTDSGIERMDTTGTWTTLSTAGLPSASAGQTVGTIGAGTLVAATSTGFFAENGTTWSALTGANCPTSLNVTRSQSNPQGDGTSFFWKGADGGEVWSIDAQGNCYELATDAVGVTSVSKTQVALTSSAFAVELVDAHAAAPVVPAADGLAGVYEYSAIFFNPTLSRLFVVAASRIYSSDTLGL